MGESYGDLIVLSVVLILVLIGFFLCTVSESATGGIMIPLVLLTMGCGMYALVEFMDIIITINQSKHIQMQNQKRANTPDKIYTIRSAIKLKVDHANKSAQFIAIAAKTHSNKTAKTVTIDQILVWVVFLVLVIASIIFSVLICNTVENSSGLMVSIGGVVMVSVLFLVAYVYNKLLNFYADPLGAIRHNVNKNRATV